MRELLWFAVLGLVLPCAIGSASFDDTTRNESTARTNSRDPSSSLLSLSSTLGNATCASRTANYITHTLPQQCLRTDRVASHAAKTNGTDSTTGVNVTSSTISQHGSSDGILGSDQPTPEDASQTGDSESATTAVYEEATTRKASLTELHQTASESATLPAPEEDTDSPLDNANFLSFEEWKRQNQPKAGQGEQANSHAADRPRPINNALDSLGDEGEIDLDFAGFGGTESGPRQQQAAYRAADSAASSAASYAPRSKDAGKTCKERTNYASFDCAATMLKNNPECKSASSVLVENKDSYMLNICSAQNKFFIVELCNDILVDTVVLANYEFFSSIFRHFRVSVSDRYPVKMDKWIDLGTLEGRNTREVQAFLIKNPQIWARYLRIEFLTHYGSEYYCPVSLLRVHGTNMLEDIRPEEESVQGENTEDALPSESEVTGAPTSVQDRMEEHVESIKATLPPPTLEDFTTGDAPPQERTVLPSATTHQSQDEILSTTSSTVSTNNTDVLVPAELPLFDGLTCISDLSSAKTNSTFSAQNTTESSDAPGAQLSDGAQPVTEAASTPDPAPPGTSTSTEATLMAELSNSESKANGSQERNVFNTTISASTSSGTTMAASSEVDVGPVSSVFSSMPASQSDETSSTFSTSANSTRHASATSSLPQPQPSTQESFFKSIHKRLQQLEANSTLSLQYIEEQSRILRDAFSKVEKRQISATTNFLSSLNETVMNELRSFGKAYDQLWQSTVIELEGQREQYQREMLALSTRLTLVADELVWQKRMGIVQSTLLLLCLGLVIFARTGSGYLEVPIMQQMMNRSQAALSRGWESPPASPSPESRSPVALFRRKLWRSATEPGQVSDIDSRPETKDGPPPDVKVQPPTPQSETLSLTPESEDDDMGSAIGDEDAFIDQDFT